MKLLHIFRSDPDAATQFLVDALSSENENESVALFEDFVDYDELVQQIFDADRLVSWW